MSTIGIIGNGRFGGLISKYIPSLIYDIDPARSPNTLKEVMECEDVILAVPMRRLESICKTVYPLSRIGQHFMDVCSLKMFSRDIIKRELQLPKLFATGLHPLFGPQSAKDGIKGQRVVVTEYDINGSCVKWATKFCEDLGLEVIVSTPEEHDKQMAASQALLHFIGRAVESGFVSEKIEERITMKTKSYDDMLSLIALVRGSSPELFEDMQLLNPFAADMRHAFLDCAVGLNRRLGEFL